MEHLSVRYAGESVCEISHPGGAKIRTGVPRAGGGAGEFSPTDLIAAGLASCILSTVAIVAERIGVDISGARAGVGKHMAEPPRRIARLPVVITLPASVSPEHRVRLERAGRACPVHASLHPEVDSPIEYRYEDVEAGGA